MVNVNEHITNYSEYVNNSIDRISKITFEEKDEWAERLYKKTLFIGLLDNMALVAFPTAGNRERMTKVIREFANWNDSDKISLPYLLALTQRTSDAAYDNARNFAIAELGKWARGHIIPISGDPDLRTAANLWPIPMNQDVDRTLKISLEDLQHLNLFYTYRNIVVHESRRPGIGDDPFDLDYPYYRSSTIVDSNSPTGRLSWELIYSVNFFTKLCQTSLSNLTNYLVQNQIDPFQSFVFEEFLIKALNLGLDNIDTRDLPTTTDPAGQTNQHALTGRSN